MTTPSFDDKAQEALDRAATAVQDFLAAVADTLAEGLEKATEKLRNPEDSEETS